MKAGFIDPPLHARPKVYWWCLNGNIDTLRAREEFSAMKKAGISGFDLFEIGVPKGDTISGGPAFLSDESLKVIKWVVREAGKLDLTVGLNLASSWNAGGAWIQPHHGGKSLYCSSTQISGGSSFKSIKLPFPTVSFPKSSLIGGTDKPMIPFRDDGKPVYYEEVSVIAIPAGVPKNTIDTAQIINVSGFFDPKNEILKWNAPSGDWEILRFICSNSGQQLVLPSPLSAGLTIDHFDSVAVETHLMYVINRLKPVLGDFRNTALKSFYLASYEARGFVWTSSLPAEFKRINGYDIWKYLPSFFRNDLYDPEEAGKIDSDFKKTLSELMINNLYKKSKEICNSYGLQINCEAGGPGYPLYNGPAEPLKALGSLDIPRGEFWINHSRYYKDVNGIDSIDILRVVKEVSSASHIYEKKIVEEESFTSFMHWQEGPSDMKPAGDRAFCEGMNKVVFHGFSHNPEGTGYPGIVYNAGTHFNDKRVWWSKAKPFIDYLSRLSFVFQETDFVADVLYYYGDKVPNSATPKNTHFSAGPGYDYEVINTEILLTRLSVKNGKLLLSNGAEFSVLALEKEEAINPAVSLKLKELADQGALIISGTETPDMLRTIKLIPDFHYPGDESAFLDYIHYRVSGIDYYFIRNTTGDWFSRECSFRQHSKVPEIWNPLTGDIVKVTVYDEDSGSIKVPLTLPPFGSCLVVFRESVPSPHYISVSSLAKTTPRIEYTKEGILFLDPGIYTLTDNKVSKTIKSTPDIYSVEGPWSLSFSKGWGAPDSVVFNELSSWTESEIEGVRYYSGTGTYQKSFNYQSTSVLLADQRVYLDLGDLSKVAGVWLNGNFLGISWALPYKYDITGYLKQGENILRVEIANTWSNRIVGDALTGKKFTKTNVLNTQIPGIDKIRFPWGKVPLIRSGLFGPVKILTVSLVK